MYSYYHIRERCFFRQSKRSDYEAYNYAQILFHDNDLVDYFVNQ